MIIGVKKVDFEMQRCYASISSAKNDRESANDAPDSSLGFGFGVRYRYRSKASKISDPEESN